MKLNCFLICDDIRNEIGNKHSLIGVYDDSINFSVPPVEIGRWPKVIKLGIYIKLDFEDESERINMSRFRIECAMNNETVTLIDGPVNILQKEIKGINVAAVINQFIIKATGELDLKFCVYNKKNEILGTFFYPKKIIIQEQMIGQNS